MRRSILLRIVMCGILACVSMAASASVNWEGSGYGFRETYDFKVGELYYGIISESRSEVMVMNPNTITYDPYPATMELTDCPDYRVVNFDGKITVWPGAYYEGDILIPSQVEHNDRSYTVVRIGYGAFAWCDKLTSVQLPATLREIRYGAFSMCTSLKEIVIPDGVRVCGGAFYGCSSLKKVDFSGCDFQYNHYDRVVCQCLSLETVYLPKEWYDECYHTYLDELNPEQERILGEYYEEYDDFPFVRSEQESSLGDRNMPRAAQPMSDAGLPERNMSSNPCELQGCVNLREIHAQTSRPLDVRTMHAFNEIDGWEGLYASCVLYVPKGSLEAYESTEPWCNFENIIEEGSSGVEVVRQDDNIAVRKIYDLHGVLREILEDGECTHLTPGVYIECRGNTVTKVVVR